MNDVFVISIDHRPRMVAPTMRAAWVAIPDLLHPAAKEGAGPLKDYTSITRAFAGGATSYVQLLHGNNGTSHINIDKVPFIQSLQPHKP